MPHQRRLGLVVGQPARERAHGRARVRQPLVGRQRRMLGQTAAGGHQRLAIVELAVERLGAVVERLQHRRQRQIFQPRRLQLLARRALVAQQIGDLAAHQMIERLRHRRTLGVGPQRLHAFARAVGKVERQPPPLALVQRAPLLDERAQPRRHSRGGRIFQSGHVARVELGGVQLVVLQVQPDEPHHHHAPRRHRGLARQEMAQKELLLGAAGRQLHFGAEPIGAPVGRHRAVERQRVDRQALLARAGRDQLSRRRRRILAVPRRVAELHRHGGGRDRGRIGLRRGKRHAKQHAVIAGVDHAVMVRVVEELRHVQALAVAREGRLAGDARQIERQRHRRARRRVEPHRLQPCRGARGKPGPTRST